MATTDANLRFTTIDVGSMGRFSDGNIFAASVLGQMLKEGNLPLKKPKPLPGQLEATPFVFVGDVAFPLSKHMMRPYPRIKVTGNQENKIYNYRLSIARQWNVLLEF